jgi:hypothetical protein
MFYFPSKIITLILHYFNVNQNTYFKLYSWLILIHYFFGSLLAFATISQLFSYPVALFGALTLVYNSYNVKPQTPCQAFSSCWLMGILLPFPYGAICFGMAILGGYFPIIIPLLPITILNPSCLLGIVIGLPQLIPFAWYFPKSCRAKKLPDPNWGKVPWWRYFIHSRLPTTGIHYPEFMFGVGICAVLCIFPPFTAQKYIWLLFALIGVLGTRGYLTFARIPARWLYLVSYSTVYCSLFAITGTFWAWVGVGVQSWLLFKNRSIYPHFPYSQWWNKPSMLDYSNKVFPGNTGYMTEKHVQNYYGGFSLAENAK